MEYLFVEGWFLYIKRKSITVSFAWQLANFTYHVLTLTQLTLANISETGGIRSPNRGCRCLLLAPTCQPRWLEKWATENPRPHRQKHCRIRCVHVWRLYAKLKIGTNFKKQFIAMSKLIHRLSTPRILFSLHETQGVHLSHPSQTPQPGRVTISFWFLLSPEGRSTGSTNFTALSSVFKGLFRGRQSLNSDYLYLNFF